MNNKKSLWWIVVVIALPFIVMLGLHIGIALGNYFHININVPNIDAASWFMFFGSYLAGVMTFAGVVATLRHERKIHQYEHDLENIDKEKERIGNAICAFNLFAPGLIYVQVSEMLVSSKEPTPSDVIVLRQHVNEEMHRILTAKTELEFTTDIYFIAGKRATCKEQCEMKKTTSAFIEVYESVGEKIYNTLNKINDYILTLERNLVCKSSEPEKQIDDIKSYQKEIDVALEEIAKFNQDKIQKLTDLGRTYIGQKKQDVYKKCFPVKEG